MKATIDTLRKQVLTLAVQGKLVPQDPSEGTAEELYEQIQAERARTHSTGRNRTQKPLPPITPEELPFEIPETWKWVRLGEVVQMRIGKTPSRSNPAYWRNGTIPWVAIADLRQGETLSITKESTNAKAAAEVFKHNIAPKGSLLFSFKLTIGKMSILNMDAYHNEAIASFTCIDNDFRDYLFYALRSLNVAERTSNAIKGKTLNGTTMPLIELPLPPLAEQKRIVAKVEEVMQQLDLLEQEVGDIETTLDTLEKETLSFAVQGKLVPQDSEETDMPKSKLVTVEPLPGPMPASSLPANWQLSTLEDLGIFSGGKTPSKARKDYWEGSHAWISSVEVKGQDIENTRHHISDAALDGLRLYPVGTLVMVVRSGVLKHSFPVSMTVCESTVNQDIKAFQPHERDTARYIQIMLKGFERYILSARVKKGMTVESVQFDDFKKTLFPIPPLAEQKRIVAKVEEVIALIRTLRDITN